MVYDQTCQSRLRRNHIKDARYDMFRRHGTQRSSVIRDQTWRERFSALITAFHNFINPFKVEVKEDLFFISSGARALHEVANDILNTEAVGKAAFKTFIQKRLVVKTLKFLKMFGSLEKKKKLNFSKMKIVQISAQRNLFGQLLILSEDNNLSLQKVLQYPLGSVSWALTTPGGLPVKTDKAKLMHQREDDAATVHYPCLDDLGVYVVDRNALLHALTALPQTLGELSDKLFSILPNVKRVDFVTDTYKDNSVKSAETRR